MEGGVEATQVAGEEQVGPGGADFDLGHIVKLVTLFRVHQIQFQGPVQHISKQIQIISSFANTLSQLTQLTYSTSYTNKVNN